MVDGSACPSLSLAYRFKVLERGGNIQNAECCQSDKYDTDTHDGGKPETILSADSTELAIVVM